MPKFIKKPSQIEAREYTGKNAEEIMFWIGSNMTFKDERPVQLVKGQLFLKSPEGEYLVMPYDWIVKGESATLGVHFWPVKPDYFEENYQEVN